MPADGVANRGTRSGSRRARYWRPTRSRVALVGLIAFAFLAPSSGPTTGSGSNARPDSLPPTLCGEYIACPVDVPDAGPGTGDVTILLRESDASVYLTMHSWVVVRGNCGETPIGPVSGGRRSSNVYVAELEFGVGETLDCSVQVNQEYVDVVVTFDPPDADAVRERCDVSLLLVGCSSGAEWFTYEPSAIFPGPVGLALVGGLALLSDDG